MISTNSHQSQIFTNGSFEIQQSAYGKIHSTETTILSVLGGLFAKSDQRLVGSDAAFDTLDHSIL